MADGSTPSGTDGNGIEAAAAAFAGILGGSEASEPKEDDGTPAEALEADDPEASGVEATDDGEDSPESEDADPADDDSEEEPTQTRKFTVKVDGTEIEVDESELVKGYQREADYTRKTQAVAEERKAVESVKAQIAAERQRYADGLQQLSQYLASTAPQPPASDLLDADPVEYLRQQRAFEDYSVRMAAVQQEQEMVGRQTQAERTKAFQATVQQENGKLIDKIPAWKDNAKATEDKKAIASYLLSNADAKYDPSEINNLVDHRALIIARKAMLYDKIMAKKPEVDRKTAEAPKFQKPGAQKTVKTQGQQRFDAKVNRLRDSGRVEDAAAVFRDML